MATNDPTRRISLNDIAKHLDVSPMTVSNAINKPEKVSEETRKRILQTMKEMGYKKDVFASINARRRKGTKKEHTVTFVLTFGEKEASFDFSFFRSAAYFAALRYLRERDVQCLTVDTGKLEEKYLNDILSSDAVIMLTTGRDDNAYNTLKEYGIERVVSVAHYAENAVTVRCDNRKVGDLAAQFFYSQGHRHVAYLGYYKEPEDDMMLRSRSFDAAFRMQGDDVRVDRIDYSIEKSIERGFTKDPNEQHDTYLSHHLLHYLRTVDTLPTAIFVPFGIAVSIVYNHFRNMGISVGDDIGVLGFDDFLFLRLIDPPATTITYDVGALGIQAANTALMLIESERSTMPLELLIAPHLVERQSVKRADEMLRGASRELINGYVNEFFETEGTRQVVEI